MLNKIIYMNYIVFWLNKLTYLNLMLIDFLSLIKKILESPIKNKENTDFCEAILMCLGCIFLNSFIILFFYKMGYLPKVYLSLFSIYVCLFFLLILILISNFFKLEFLIGKLLIMTIQIRIFICIILYALKKTPFFYTILMILNFYPIISTSLILLLLLIIMRWMYKGIKEWNSKIEYIIKIFIRIVFWILMYNLYILLDPNKDMINFLIFIPFVKEEGFNSKCMILEDKNIIGSIFKRAENLINNLNLHNKTEFDYAPEDPDIEKSVIYLYEKSGPDHFSFYTPYVVHNEENAYFKIPKKPWVLDDYENTSGTKLLDINKKYPFECFNIIPGLEKETAIAWYGLQWGDNFLNRTYSSGMTPKIQLHHDKVYLYKYIKEYNTLKLAKLDYEAHGKAMENIKLNWLPMYAFFWESTVDNLIYANQSVWSYIIGDRNEPNYFQWRNWKNYQLPHIYNSDINTLYNNYNWYDKKNPFLDRFIYDILCENLLWCTLTILIKSKQIEWMESLQENEFSTIPKRQFLQKLSQIKIDTINENSDIYLAFTKWKIYWIGKLDKDSILNIYNNVINKGYWSNNIQDCNLESAQVVFNQLLLNETEIKNLDQCFHPNNNKTHENITFTKEFIELFKLNNKENLNITSKASNWGYNPNSGFYSFFNNSSSSEFKEYGPKKGPGLNIALNFARTGKLSISK